MNVSDYEEFIENLENRISILGFFSFIFSNPPTKEIYQKVAGLNNQPIKVQNSDISLKDIEIEFADLFAVPSPSYLYPYESYHVSLNNTHGSDISNPIGGPVTSKIGTIFKKQNYNHLEFANELPDYLGCEIGYLRHLSVLEKKLVEKKSQTDVKELFKLQFQFLEDHILLWLPRIVNKAKSVKSTGFYHAFLQDFLELAEFWKQSIPHKISN
jgi:TorA maturation chaperone TorD